MYAIRVCVRIYYIIDSNLHLRFYVELSLDPVKHNCFAFVEELGLAFMQLGCTCVHGYVNTPHHTLDRLPGKVVQINVPSIGSQASSLECQARLQSDAEVLASASSRIRLPALFSFCPTI